MADADVQGLLVRIEATTAQMRQELARGEASVASTATRMDTQLKRVDDAFDRAGEHAESMREAMGGVFNGVALGAAAAVAGLVAITQKTAEYATQVKSQAALSNTTTDQFQRLAAGARTVSVEQEKLADIFKDTTDRVGEFTQRGGGEMADFFKEIAPRVGVTAKMFQNLSGPDALQLYYNSLEKAGLNQQQVTTYMEAMADEATALIPLLKNNGAGFKDFGDKAERAGNVLSSFQLDQFAEIDQTIKTLGVSFDGASKQLATGLLPGVQSVADRLNSMSDNGAMELIGQGVGFLADNVNVLAAILGGKAAAAFVSYTQSIVNSGAAVIQSRAANMALASSAVDTAAANQLAAQSAVVRAEREAIAARGTAVQTQMSIQLAEARMAEKAATDQVAAAQTRLAAARGTVMGFLGGPAGLAALAAGVAIAFFTLRDNTADLEKRLGDLADPMDKLIGRFEKLNRATQAVTLRELQATIADTQSKIGQMSGAMADKFENDLRGMGAAGADGLMSGLVNLPADTQAALELVRKASKDQAAGVAVDWKAVADQLRTMPGVTEDMARSLESSQAPVADLSALLQKQQQTLASLTAETDKNTASQNQNTAAKTMASAAGEKYIADMTKQLQGQQDKTFTEQANRFISENKDLTEAQIVAIRSLGAARDAQKTSDDAATQATKDSASATKKAASEEEARQKALKDLKTQADIAIASAQGLAAAYADGTDRSRELSIQQKAEEALLKTGAAARSEVIAKLNAERDAQDSLSVSKAAYDLERETSDLVAHAKAQLQGSSALEAYNLQKSMTVALAGKNIDFGSKEYDQLLKQTKAQVQATKALEAANKANDLVDRLNPQLKLLKDYAEDQKALNEAITQYPEKADLYRESLTKLGQEYDDNQAKMSVWGRLTEAAVDRVDKVFADMWLNVGDGFKGFSEGLMDGFKQLLAELAHEAITKPILISFANTVLGTNKSGGVGDVIGALSGEGDSSSGSGGIASVANKLYSAYNIVTGVGAKVVAGYAEAGIPGAAKAGVGYYTDKVSALYDIAKSGMATLLGQQTALQIAQQAATQAALNYGITEGVASTVGQFTLDAAGQQIAAGMVQQAATQGVAQAAGAQGASSGATSALGSAASMWPLAVLMGMIQSGKLYSAGVRPDASEMYNSAGGTGLGKVVMSIPTLTAKAFEIVDGALSKIVGGKAAAILTGSTLYQAVWSKVGSKLFGTGYQTKDAGIQLAVKAGEFDALQYTKQKKKGGLISGSSKTRYLYNELPDDTEDALGSEYNTTVMGAMALFTQLGVKLNDSVLDGLNMASAQISTQGKTSEQIQAEIDHWFALLGDQVVVAVSKATDAGVSGFSYVGLQAFVKNLYDVNTMLKHVNIGLYDMSVTGGFMAEQLSAMGGGFEELQKSVSGYYDAFFSDNQKSIDTISDIQDVFDGLNIKLPDSRDGFRAMVEGIDKSTEAGRKLFVTLMTLASTADQAYDIIEARQKTYYDAFYSESENTARTVAGVTAEFKKANVTLPASREGYRALVDGIDRTTESGKTLYNTLTALAGSADTFYKAQEQVQAAAKTAALTSVSNAMSALQRAVAAEKSALTAAYNARMTSLNDMLSTAQANVSGLTNTGNALEAALKSLNGTSETTVRTLREQAKATLQSALASAQGGGSLSGFAGLDDALTAVSTNTTDMYGSLEDFTREQGRTANVVAQLNAINGVQLTAQQQLLKSVQEQIANAKDQFDLQMSGLDDQLEAAQKQLDALNGIDTSILSVAQALIAFNASVQAAIAGAAAAAAAANKPAAPSGGGYTGTAGGAGYNDINAIYQAVLGRDADYAGSVYWGGKAGSMTPDQLAAQIKADATANGEIKGYASGGFHSGGLRLVGENGPELEVTGPSRIYNADQTAAMLRGGGDNSALLAEVRQLRAESRQAQFQIAKNTQQLGVQLRKWDDEGTPKERDYSL
jgi:hypothetical protein